MIEDLKNRNKLEYYKSLSEEALSKYPQTFREFVVDKNAMKEGDLLLVSGIATAYNFASESEFPLSSDKPLIIYNNYIQRRDHFADLLNLMDRQGLISDSNFRFGAKATKVRGNWGDKETVVSEIVRNGREEQCSESVEGCLILYPKDPMQAIAMINFLDLNTIKNDDTTYINGSWQIPDIRTTGVLEEILKVMGYSMVYANLLSFNSGNIITLKRDEKVIKDGWKNNKVLVNELLYDFID